MAGVGTSLQLDSVTLQWSCNQPIASSNQDAAVGIECNVGDVDSGVSYVGQLRLLNYELVTDSRSWQSHCRLDK